MPELAEKWPAECLPMGATVGGLMASSAAHLVMNPKESLMKLKTDLIMNPVREPYETENRPTDAHTGASRGADGGAGWTRRLCWHAGYAFPRELYKEPYDAKRTS